MNCLDCGSTLDGCTLDGCTLEGVSQRRCPECGRGFDPADDGTFYIRELALRTGVRCLWAALACIAYAVFLITRQSILSTI